MVTVIPTHGAIARATFNAQIGGKVLMTLKYGNKSVPFGAIVTHGENKNGSIVAENGQVYLTGLPQSGQLQVSWGKDKNSNCIVSTSFLKFLWYLTEPADSNLSLRNNRL